MTDFRIDDKAAAFDDAAYALNEQDKARVAALADAINFADPRLTFAYGARAMTETAKFAEELLAQMRAQNDDPLSRALSTLATQLKNLNIAGLPVEKISWGAQLPVLGGFFDPIARIEERFIVLSDDLDSLTEDLQTSLDAVLRDLEIMEQLYKLNREFYHELTLDIAVGKKRLSSAAPPATDVLNRFENRLYDLQLSRAITVQTEPQLSLILSNDKKLLKSLRDGALTIIPAWKEQMESALENWRKQGAAYANLAEDIKSLSETHGKLLESVKETLQIITEICEDRRKVEDELSRMEGYLRGQLTCPPEGSSKK